MVFVIFALSHHSHNDWNRMSRGDIVVLGNLRLKCVPMLHMSFVGSITVIFENGKTQVFFEAI